ncbi:MAG TPA: HEAT repeat domain-containing protein [Armatimonadota bacterium]|nr:HEAT repeat domain-containing protein [Armatimonadota bacterium]
MPPVRRVEQWIRQLDSRQSRTRQRAIAQLATSGDLRAWGPLLACLKHSSHITRADACAALVILGGARALEPLVGRLGEGNRRVREAAARALGRLGDARAVEPLLALCTDRSLPVRLAAGEALAALGDVRAYEHLLRLLQEGDRGMRATVCRALGRLRDPRAVDILLERLPLERKFYEVRMAIYTALGQGALLDALDHLLRTGDTGPLFRLGQEAQTLVVPVLLRWTTRQDARLRLAACRVLGALRTTAALPQVAKCVHDPMPTVREAACTALGAMGAAREVRKVAARVGDTAPVVRRAALDALERLGQVELAEAARAMFAGDPSALAALVLAGEQAVTKPLLELLAATRFDIPLQRALISLFQCVWAAQAAAAPRMLCRPCLLRPTPREYRTWLAGRARVLTCRGCGAVLQFAPEVREVVAVLDSRETKAVSVHNGIARVCWPRRETLCDFDRVEIRAADDYTIERFCMSAGNDLDPYRAPRRRDIPVTVACALSENALRVLEHIFGTVRVARKLPEGGE